MRFTGSLPVHVMISGMVTGRETAMTRGKVSLKVTVVSEVAHRQASVVCGRFPDRSLRRGGEWTLWAGRTGNPPPYTHTSSLRLCDIYVLSGSTTHEQNSPKDNNLKKHVWSEKRLVWFGQNILWITNTQHGFAFPCSRANLSGWCLLCECIDIIGYIDRFGQLVE